jgi:hypothetical protein
MPTEISANARSAEATWWKQEVEKEGDAGGVLERLNRPGSSILIGQGRDQMHYNTGHREVSCPGPLDRSLATLKENAASINLLL